MKQSIQGELDRIAEDNGGVLQPEEVVNRAKNPQSPLHSKFEWDDSVAAHEHRLWQARQLIKLYVKVSPVNNQPFNAYVSLRTDRTTPGGGYRQTESVMANVATRQILLAQALDELESVRRRYEHLVELAEVFEAIRIAKKLNAIGTANTPVPAARA